MYEFHCGKQYIAAITHIKLSRVVILDTQFADIKMRNMNLIQYSKRCIHLYNNAASRTAYFQLNYRIIW
jgi:hypothetical protein